MNTVGGESGKSGIKPSLYLCRMSEWRKGNAAVGGLHSRHILRENSEALS